MPNNISVVINTLNEQKNLERAIKSVQPWVNEIIVCDMHSEDHTVKSAKKFGAKVFYCKKGNYVEPARNFAISKANGEWILILDADEEIPDALASRIKEIINGLSVPDFIEIPRKNIIFGRWMKASMWWPDYHIRLFRKGKVIWNEAIHSKPKTEGRGLMLPTEESLAIIHHNYQSVSQFIDRMNRYSGIQALELKEKGEIFSWKDLLEKPLGEFLSRFFDGKGYMDGLHGFALSLLQAFSFLVVYLNLWEMTKFKEEEISLVHLEDEKKKIGEDINYWMKYSRLSKNLLIRFFQKW